MPPLIEFPLDIPEVRILQNDLEAREITIRVESTREWAICHKCGNEIREFHGYGELLRLLFSVNYYFPWTTIIISVLLLQDNDNYNFDLTTITFQNWRQL